MPNHNRWYGDERAVSEIPFEHLEKLNLLAFGFLKPEDDNRHESRGSPSND